MTKKPNSDQAATKADIVRLEGSLKKFATKTELKKTERVLRAEILRVEERVERVGERLGGRIDSIEKKIGDKIDGIEVKLDRISNQLDGFVGRVDNLTVDNEVGAEQTRELQIRIDNHEERITRLEPT